MTIGKSSKKSLKSPKHLDLSSGFYGRLEETEAEVEAVGRGRAEGGTARREDKRGSGVFDFNQGMLEDDGTAALLRKAPARRSSRWRRKSGSGKKRAEARPEDSAPAEGSAPPAEAAENKAVAGSTGAAPTPEAGPVLLHSSVREDADDQALISRQAERETEGQRGEEEMKVVKRGKLKNYRKALDRALRRGWETFITNLYSVSLVPISSMETSSSSSSPTSGRRSSAIAQYR